MHDTDTLTATGEDLEVDVAALTRVEGEGSLRLRVRNAGTRLLIREFRETAEFPAPPVAHRLAELAREVAEEQERRLKESSVCRVSKPTEGQKCIDRSTRLQSLRSFMPRSR